MNKPYKKGFADGRNDQHSNPYPEGSQWAIDYEIGFAEGNTHRE